MERRAARGSVGEPACVADTPARFPASPASPFPLSAAQYEAWLAQQLAPDVPLCIAQYVELHGNLDVDLLRSATVAAADEFGSPFLRLIEIEGRPFQLVDPSTDRSIGLVDFRGEVDPEDAARRWMRADCATPIDLTHDRLVESSILRVDDEHYLWYSKIHHVALDGYGAMTMLNRIAARYSAAIADREPPPNGAVDPRYLLDVDEQYRSSSRFAADRQFWAERIAGLGPAPSLARRAAPAVADSTDIAGPLPEAAERALREAGQHGTATVIAGFACYLARMTGRRNVLVTIPVSARTTAVLRRSGGMVAGIVPLPVEIRPEDTVGELVERVRLDLLGALRHQRFGLGDIRRDAGAGAADTLSGPMVNVMLFHQELRLGTLVGEYHIVTSGPVEDLLIDVYQSGAPVKTFVHFLANPNRYDAEEVGAHHCRFVELLDEFLRADADAAISTVHHDTARLDFWTRTLADAPPLIELPADRPRPPRPSGRSAAVEVAIGAALRHGLTTFAAEYRTDVFTVVHAALALLLSRVARTADVVVGTAVGTEVQVSRTRVRGSEPFTELVERVRDSAREAAAHRGVSWEQIVDALDPPRSRSHAPLFQVLLDYRDRGWDLGDLDLLVTVDERHDQVRFTYAADLFDADTVSGFGHRLLRLADAALDDPSVPVGDIDLLAPAEYTLLLEWSTLPTSPPRRTLTELFAVRAAGTPDATAVVAGGERLSYGRLDARSNRLARQLLSTGVGPQSLVAVAAPRSAALVVALVAVVKAGAAYLPIDVDHPGERSALVLDDARPVCLLATQDTAAALAPSNIPVVLLDSGEAELDTVSALPVTDAERAPINPDSLAYVVYTSGSTGRPKGVAVSHGNVVALFASAEQLFRFDGTDVWTMFHSPAFDFSVWELWGALLHGATLVVADFDTTRSPAQFLEVLRRERVTVLSQTPTAFAQLIEAEATNEGAEPLPLRYVVLGGEALDLGQLARWYSRHDDNAPVLVNMYGITETTVHVSHLPLDPEFAAAAWTSVIGRAIPGFRVSVLDPRLHPVPVGVAGELYVSGPQVARGYLGRAGLTASRFVADMSGSRMYRTGDVVRWRRDGHLEYLGRDDQQVEIRGFRVELGEVESVLGRCDGVARAVVTLHRNEVTGPALAAYVVPEPGALIDPGAVLEAAESALPSYMVPGSVTVLNQLPLTVNGKIDRAALPSPVVQARADFVAPGSAVEEVLAAVFAELLNVPSVGIDDDFFGLGGNSLVAARAAARIQTELGAGVGVRDLFEAPTIRLLATRVGRAATTTRPPLVPTDRSSPVPVSLAQTRMWFLDQFDTTSPAYNIAAAFRLRGPLDAAALEAALTDVVDRHEILRTVSRWPETPPCSRYSR